MPVLSMQFSLNSFWRELDAAAIVASMEEDEAINVVRTGLRIDDLEKVNMGIGDCSIWLEEFEGGVEEIVLMQCSHFSLVY